MAFPDRLLLDGEDVVEQLHPHWIRLVPAVCWFVVVCGGAGALVAVLPHDPTVHRVLLIVLLVLAVLAVLWLSIRPWLRWLSTQYVLTSRRVLIRSGVTSRNGRDIALGRISDVAFSQTLRDRIVGAGTLTIDAAQGRQVLRDVPRADRLHQVLNRLIDEDADRRGWGQFPPMGQTGARFPVNEP